MREQDACGRPAGRNARFVGRCRPLWPATRAAQDAHQSHAYPTPRRDPKTKVIGTVKLPQDAFFAEYELMREFKRRAHHYLPAGPGLGGESQRRYVNVCRRAHGIARSQRQQRSERQNCGGR
jgi:hypothetical protein